MAEQYRSVPVLEAAARGWIVLAFGFGTLTVTTLSKVPDLIDRHAQVAALYADAIPKSALGAIGAVVAAVACWCDSKITRSISRNRVPVTGRGMASVVMFLLVPQVSLRKRLNIAAAAEKWADAVPELVIRNWQG